MLTQEELNKEYVDGPAAAKILKITSSQVRFLCSRGRLKGAMKVGTSGWLIPRESVLLYKPGKRGPKTANTVLNNAINEANNLKEDDNHDQQG